MIGVLDPEFAHDNINNNQGNKPRESGVVHAGTGEMALHGQDNAS